MNCGFKQIKRLIDFKDSTSVECYHYSKKVVKWPSIALKEIFKGMKARCYNKSSKSYEWYGKKRIHICSDWLNDPNTFIKWAIDHGYKDGMTIDRINENLWYCPSNCRWVSKEDNSKWKSTTNIIQVMEVTDSGRGWACRLGLGENTVNRYLKKHGYRETQRFIFKTAREKNILIWIDNPPSNSFLW